MSKLNLSAEQIQQAAIQLCIEKNIDPYQKGYPDIKYGFNKDNWTYEWQNWVSVVENHIDVQNAIAAIQLNDNTSARSKILCDVLHYYMFHNKATQDMSVQELKKSLSPMFGSTEIDAAIDRMTSEHIVADSK